MASLLRRLGYVKLSKYGLELNEYGVVSRNGQALLVEQDWMVGWQSDVPLLGHVSPFIAGDDAGPGGPSTPSKKKASVRASTESIDIAIEQDWSDPPVVATAMAALAVTADGDEAEWEWELALARARAEAATTPDAPSPVVAAPIPSILPVPPAERVLPQAVVVPPPIPAPALQIIIAKPAMSAGLLSASTWEPAKVQPAVEANASDSARPSQEMMAMGSAPTTSVTAVIEAQLQRAESASEASNENEDIDWDLAISAAMDSMLQKEEPSRLLSKRPPSNSNEEVSVAPPVEVEPALAPAPMPVPRITIAPPPMMAKTAPIAIPVAQPIKRAATSPVPLNPPKIDMSKLPAIPPMPIGPIGPRSLRATSMPLTRIPRGTGPQDPIRPIPRITSKVPIPLASQRAETAGGRASTEPPVSNARTSVKFAAVTPRTGSSRSATNG